MRKHSYGFLRFALFELCWHQICIYVYQGSLSSRQTTQEIDIWQSQKSFSFQAAWGSG